MESQTIWAIALGVSILSFMGWFLYAGRKEADRLNNRKTRR